jgi:hypothetical protein
MARIITLSELRTLQAAKQAEQAEQVDPKQARLDRFKRAKALEALAEARAHCASAVAPKSGVYQLSPSKVASNG